MKFQQMNNTRKGMCFKTFTSNRLETKTKRKMTASRTRQQQKREIEHRRKKTDLYSWCCLWANWWRRWPEELWRFDNFCRPAFLFRSGCWHSADRHQFRCRCQSIPSKSRAPLLLDLPCCLSRATVGAGHPPVSGRASSLRFSVFFSVLWFSAKSRFTASNSTS